MILKFEHDGNSLDVEHSEADKLPTFTDDLEFDQHALDAAKVVRCLIKHGEALPAADHVVYVAEALKLQGGDPATARAITVRGDAISGNATLLMMDKG